MSEGALDELRRLLDEADALPVGERVARFERANELLAAELATLDELVSE